MPTETGTWADWLSGMGSCLAVVVALGGYGIVEWNRRQDEKKVRQGHAYQIGFKLATLTSEALATHKALFPKGTTYKYWKDQGDPFVICGAQHPAVGFTSTMTRPLTDAEQNFLMNLKEEEFLMDLSQAFAVNDTIRQGLVEYKARHEQITAKLPSPDDVRGNMLSYDLAPPQKQTLLQHVVPAATLVQGLRTMSLENVKSLRNLCRDFHPTMHKHYPQLHLHQVEDQSTVDLSDE